MDTEKTIRAMFAGPSNVALRKRLRALIANGGNPWELRHAIAFTALGLSKLERIQKAVDEERERRMQ